MAKKAKLYSSQNILNRIFTGLALRSTSTDGGSSSGTAGGSLDCDFIEQDIWNSVFDNTNSLINIV